ncbi:glycerol dehydratase [Aminipila butyrica]|uniref:Glycerol dehydratase n=1 Tax=Aminipila butyrica TaxID=433296 RepID=A0A858BWR6_9FIRM|nr:glycerol dehydratase reactivase beta/small subunit family protein [Aminipila butyrica]QIB69164.1 glycerol dehydratase [Aminipila butyrica]
MLLSEESKPTIRIHVEESFGGKNILNQICFGIEEEGIPYEIIAVDDSNHIAMAYEACQHSRLGVGIGITEGHIALHYEKLQAESPLFNISTHDEMGKIRSIGTNGARLVKRMPFRTIQE